MCFPSQQVPLGFLLPGSLSLHLSNVECSFEASCQLVLKIAIRLSRGQMHLANTSFTKRIALTLRFMPVFSLTAFFRCDQPSQLQQLYTLYRTFYNLPALLLHPRLLLLVHIAGVLAEDGDDGPAAAYGCIADLLPGEGVLHHHLVGKPW